MGLPATGTNWGGRTMGEGSSPRVGQTPALVVGSTITSSSLEYGIHCLVPLLLSLFVGAGTPGLAQQGSSSEITSQETAPTFLLRAERNLVLVRVVVRDAKGRPVAGLKKEDFRIL